MAEVVAAVLWLLFWAEERSPELLSELACGLDVSPQQQSLPPLSSLAQGRALATLLCNSRRSTPSRRPDCACFPDRRGSRQSP